MRDEFECRSRRRSPAREHLQRSQLLWQGGRRADAVAALQRALSSDPTDPHISRAVLDAEQGWGCAAEFDGAAAARVILTAPRANLASLAAAGARLVRAGVHHVARLHAGTHLCGWICWRAGMALSVRIPSGNDVVVQALGGNPDLALATVMGAAAHIRIPLPADALRYEIRLDGCCVEQGELAGPVEVQRLAVPGQRRSKFPTGQPAVQGQPAQPAQPPRIAVIVPVFDDFDATRDSLLSAVAACGHQGRARLVVVDDASIDPRIGPFVDRLAAGGRLQLLRNHSNLGFVGSVNRALQGIGADEDIVLLNADAYLPVPALERLAAVAHGDARIGTVTPLSNNGELVNFPVPDQRNPAPSRDEASALDACAWRTFGPAAVDLPNGIGFCLYVKSSCLAAVGGLGDVYHRGYFEDVDLCLRARARGFRNVCAPGIFVVHEGSLSFKTEKRALVKRNLKVLLERFPEIEAASDAFRRADPLARYRAGLETALAAWTPNMPPQRSPAADMHTGGAHA